ncbi:MAG TPA: DNA repair protein [Pseudolabrys sp.]|jgi:protein ImuA
MLEQLRQRLQALQKTVGIGDGPGALPLGIAPIDAALGGGLARGALHEIAAVSEAHLAAATGFTLGLTSLPSPRLRGEGERVCWIAEDMALAESGAPYGPGLDAFGLAPERLLTVSAAQPRDLLWAMEEALRCRAVGAVIGELRDSAVGTVALRRLSLAAAESGALALLLRSAPSREASTAATRWIVGTASKTCFAAQLVRNRRGPLGSWILEWSDSDERFLLATPAQPVAAPALDRSHRQVA